MNPIKPSGLLCDFPYSGKTYIGEKILGQTSCVYVSIDNILEGLHYDWDTNKLPNEEGWKKVFDMAVGVAEIFRKGAFKDKDEALSEICSNLVISAKKVTVKHKKSIEAFKDFLLLARSEDKAFEPRNWKDLRTKEPFLGGSDVNSDTKLRW